MTIVAKWLDGWRRHIVLDDDPAPLPKRGTAPQFLAHICCDQMAGWIKMPLCTLYYDAMVIFFHFTRKVLKALLPNYRPISLTSVCSKIMEHTIYSNGCKHLEYHGILTPRQHGFRPRFSCETQLVSCINDWAKWMAIAIFNFSKAFDGVPHCRLFSKLSQYGICGTVQDWLHSFLSDRYQRVVVNGAQSSWLPVLSGVPQGTVLGPLLFLIYINDIVLGIDSEICFFADDCILYREIDP